MTNMDFIEMAPVDDEDSAFLVVSENSPKSHKKTEYEPSVLQTCQCCRCGTKRVTFCLLVAVVIVTSALIGVLARPIWLSACLGNTQVADQSTTSSPATETTTQELSSNGTPYPWKDVRLPRNILPDSYHIHMHPNLTESWFRGKVEIRLRVENETKFIIFHAKSINITSQVLMYDSPGKRRVDIIQTMAYKPFEQYYLALGRTLLTGDKVVLILEFDGVLERKLTGFYKSSYKTKTNETRDIATTDFEPTDARTAFPCFDEPDIKANFSLSMVRDRHHISLFNMPLKGSDPYQGSALLVEDKFEASVKMSTYLVAFVVCDFANLTSSTESGVKVRVFAPPDNIQEGQFALDIAIKVLPFYEEFFGIKYPLPKQDLIAIPDFNSGAMENWGLITYRTTSVLYDPEATSFSSQQHVASTVAHELAHQWFGNLVTMKWWDDLWLNEGFASYMEYIGTNIVKPEWKMLEQFFIEDMHDALSLDALATSHAIQTHVTNPNQINEIFDSISYNKGSTLVRMLHNFLGEANFKKGLQAYLKKYMFRNSETANLWDSLSQFSKDVDVKAMMDTWTLQMGYPVVNLIRTGNTITATQERFLLDSEDVTQQKPSQFGYKWYIPLNYITSENVNTSSEAMMKLSSVTFDVPPQTTWIKANVGMYGLYRVNYDESMWRQLTELLLTNHKILSPNDRAGLIDDAFTLAGPLNVTVALNLSSYLIHERDYAPWVKAISQLGYMRHRLQDSPVYADLKKYILHLLRPVLRGLKWDKTLSHLDNFLRDDVFKAAITLGEESTIAEAKKRFATWTSANQSLDADLKSIVYKAAIQYGGETEWEFCWNRYLETNIASEKKLLLLALHKTRDTQLLTRLLHYSLDPNKIRAQDCDDVIGGVAGNPAGKLLAWRFLRQNWVRIRDRVGFGAFAMTGLIKRTLSSFSTQFDYDEVKAFFDGRDVGPGARAVQQALERIKMNIDWLETHEVTVANWLRDRNS